MPRTPDFATKPTLVGERVTLRPFRDEDVPVMAEVLADPEVLRLTGSVHSTAEADAGAPDDPDVLRRWYTTRNDQDDRLDLVVVDNAAQRCVGEVVLNEWDRESASCNFRILIGPAGRDRGLGTEATRLTLRHAFGALGLHRVSLTVFAFNPRARRAYEKAGFVVEGVAREAFRSDDRWIDDIHMAALAHEWLPDG
ncbi:GNAT family N-acetyltransferase [Georgenia subflava]|uniref:GNAT family N-acetyltransferase n=1 Tax=Georgenia subflava TaxID=1622177 RepID=A0A6N7EGB6_9MICO|nr:GNAT family protein [Georgenia subflava]MPV36441.1 GNAT family N-acetyltransferase [Georgenia subflava]